jgi:hypothetical protein
MSLHVSLSTLILLRDNIKHHNSQKVTTPVQLFILRHSPPHRLELAAAILAAVRGYRIASATRTIPQSLRNTVATQAQAAG